MSVPTLPEMAAVYLHSIVLNHPCMDGDKRTGVTVATVFLRLNHMRITADETEFTDLVLKVAQGKTTKYAVAAFLRAHTSAL